MPARRPSSFVSVGRDRACGGSGHTAPVSFLRKLFNRGDPAQDTPRERRPSPAPSRSESPPARPEPRRKTPTLADLSPAPHHAYFEFVGGSSSKFYAVSLEEEEGGTWRVQFTYGRIGSTRAWDARVERAPWRKAANAYDAIVDERTGKGYELRPWPAALKLPDGGTVDGDEPLTNQAPQVLFRAARRGELPPASGGTIAGIALPDGVLYAPEPEGGSRGDGPVIWASIAPVPQVSQLWSRLAAEFGDTGIWPLVVDADHRFTGYDNYLMDTPRGRHKEAVAVLRKGWNDVVGYDEDEPDEAIAPFGRQFPGLAAATPGPRADSVDRIVAGLSGHLALVAVHRPADAVDAVGWMGAANYDGDPLDMSTVLRSWELRFDAYLVDLGTDTMTLAVGRPPRDLASATAIAAEHYAFCPDNIDQGVGSIREYAASLVNESAWPFWWD